MAIKKKRNLQIKTTLTLITAILITIIVYLFRNKLTILGTFGYFGIFLLSILGNATIILPLPSILTAYLGGGIFNPFWVGIIAALGATIGELTGYLAGYGGRTIIEDPKKLEKIESWMKKYGLWTIFVLAVIPNPLFDLAGIASGMLKVPVWKYFLVTWAGKTIKFLGFSYLGAGSFKLIEKFS
ncbi:VTT domain-containing protein [Patescibacteria group bacterium]|nr:VTT domain-containing protein [Patescibacteria group bacterium]MBU2036326.1 VTT domain-containing protein [Patescibacteria group bacterium]